MSALGYWREPGQTPHGKIEWQKPGKAGLQTHVGIINGKPVAKVKVLLHGKECIVSIDGWMWTSFPTESGTAKLNIKESPLRAFATVREAKQAVSDAVAELPALAD